MFWNANCTRWEQIQNTSCTFKQTGLIKEQNANLFIFETEISGNVLGTCRQLLQVCPHTTWGQCVPCTQQWGLLGGKAEQP